MYTASKDDNIANLKNSAQGLRSAAEDTAQDIKGSLQDVANDAGRKVRSFIDSASDELSHAGDKVATQIRNNPVQSSAIALGVGIVIGALLRR